MEVHALLVMGVWVLGRKGRVADEIVVCRVVIRVSPVCPTSVVMPCPVSWDRTKSHTK